MVVRISDITSGSRTKSDVRSTEIARLRVASRLLSHATTLWRQKENVVLQKRMFKVITPMEGRDGKKWWLRCGSGFTNKDDSLNLYINCLPLGKGEITLQVRELTEEDLRSRDDKRAQYAAARPAAAPAQQALDTVPF